MPRSFDRLKKTKMKRSEHNFELKKGGVHLTPHIPLFQGDQMLVKKQGLLMATMFRDQYSACKISGVVLPTCSEVGPILACFCRHTKSL